MGFSREACVNCGTKIRVKPNNTFIVYYCDEPWHTTLIFECKVCTARILIFISGDLESLREYELDDFDIVRNNPRAPDETRKLYRELVGQPPLRRRRIKKNDKAVVNAASKLLPDDAALAEFLERVTKESPPDSTS